MYNELRVWIYSCLICTPRTAFLRLIKWIKWYWIKLLTEALLYTTCCWSSALTLLCSTGWSWNGGHLYCWGKHWDVWDLSRKKRFLSSSYKLHMSRQKEEKNRTQLCCTALYIQHMPSFLIYILNIQMLGIQHFLAIGFQIRCSYHI